MSFYETLLLLTGAASLLLSLASGNGRGALWVSVIAIDLILSDAYGGPYPEAAMAALDFTVCVAILIFGTRRWEMWVFVVMQFSMLVSIVDLASNIFAPGWIDREIYLLILELANYAAFITIGGISSFVLSDRVSGRAFGPWRHVFSFDNLVRKKNAPTER